MSRSPVRDIPAWVGPVLSAVMVPSAAARAVDYWHAQPGDLALNTDLWTPDEWAVLFGLVAVALAGALLLRGARPTRVGVAALTAVHGLAAVLYVMAAIALMQGAHDPGHGWRLVASAAVGASIHAVRAATLPREMIPPLPHPRPPRWSRVRHAR